MSRSSLSLRLRLSVAIALVLALFLGLTGWVLDRSFQQAARQALQDRLQAHIYTLLAVAELDAEGRLRLPAQLPEPRFSAPGSGLYAQVVGADGKALWRSHSVLGRQLPLAQGVAAGTVDFRYQTRVESMDVGLFTLRFGVEWEDEQGRLWPFTLEVIEDDVGYARQLTRYRGTLWTGLGAVAAALLLVQLLVLAWGLQPLRRLAAELKAVDAGRQRHLHAVYPREIAPLTDNINRFVDQQRASRDRYRDSLADLAHSLKTPLAVLGSTLAQPEPDREQASAQLHRMADIVNYQLGRAATAGAAPMAAAVAIKPLAISLRNSLDKVYADKDVDCRFQLDDPMGFAGDRGDLMEILGNLLDNAYKWADRQVIIGAQGHQQQTLTLWIEDDGPGVDPADHQRILQRGQTNVQARAAGSGADMQPERDGQGIGLAVVQDIVSVYRGQLLLQRSTLGGLRVVLEFPPPAG